MSTYRLIVLIVDSLAGNTKATAAAKAERRARQDAERKVKEAELLTKRAALVAEQEVHIQHPAESLLLLSRDVSMMDCPMSVLADCEFLSV